MFLETRRLIIRKFEEKDFNDYCAYSLGDPERDRMMGRNPLNTVENVRLNFDWLKNKEERGYVLELKENGKVVGNLTVYNKTPVESREELKGKRGRSMSFGISREYQRRGLMEEALSAVIDKLFQEEQAEYIHCGCFDFNLPSLNLQRKLGFVYLTTEHFEMEDAAFLGIENILWCP